MASRNPLDVALATAGFPPGTPASVATVDRAGRVEIAVAGAWPDGSDVTPDDRFYAASLSKQVTGALVALLVRRAHLDPDMPIGLFVPDLPAWGKVVTIRHLLHHLGDLPEVDPADPCHWTTERALRVLHDTSASPVPGRQYRYSNLGYVCLAIMVERVSGVSLAEFAQTHLFDALGLAGIGFTTTPDFPQLARMGDVHPLTVGDGGLWTTAPSFAAWLDHQNRDTLGIADLVQQPHAAASDYGWGLGLRTLHGHTFYIHGGGWPGAHSKAARCPALGLSIVALAATDSNDGVLALVDRLVAELS